MAYRKDFTGIKNGKLEVLHFSRVINNIVHWNVRCECGIIKEMSISNFRKNKTCGCEQHIKLVSYDYSHPLYKVWVSIKGRCYNIKDAFYFNYGKRGVIVCEEWLNNYQSFYDWCIENGWRKGMHVDKDIKGNGFLYSPEFCSITTRLENNRARRGVKLSLDKAREIRLSNRTNKELSEIYKVHPSTIGVIKSNKTWI